MSASVCWYRGQRVPWVPHDCTETNSCSFCRRKKREFAALFKAKNPAKKKVTPAMMSEIMLCRLRTLALTGYEVCNDSGTLTRHDERAMQLFEDWLEARFKIRFSYRATPRTEGR